jgi:hypothetical protein
MSLFLFFYLTTLEDPFCYTSFQIKLTPVQLMPGQHLEKNKCSKKQSVQGILF